MRNRVCDGKADPILDSAARSSGPVCDSSAGGSCASYGVGRIDRRRSGANPVAGFARRGIVESIRAVR